MGPSAPIEGFKTRVRTHFRCRRASARISPVLNKMGFCSEAAISRRLGSKASINLTAFVGNRRVYGIKHGLSPVDAA